MSWYQLDWNTKSPDGNADICSESSVLFLLKVKLRFFFERRLTDCT